ncbi:bax inhibitor 1-like [Solanum verrucosum]|uniref:bax inhibitor 1-like n=1 Tax=Solanum verrucosum TaxID=315347 RepID=UPI0020D0B477|nr:bax inhibitor 1-like [Solanum verrucosum]
MSLSKVEIIPLQRIVRDDPARRNVEEQGVPNAPEVQPQVEVTNGEFKEAIRITTEDPENFVEELQKVFEVMHVVDAKRVELDAYQLKSVARTWFDQWKKGRAEGAPILSCAMFEEVFLGNFFPRELREPKVYLTLFFAMLSFTSGSFSHWIWEAGGRFTILSSVASLLCLYFISPLGVRTRVLLLMIAAFSIGASVGIFTKYFFEIDQELVCRLLAPPTLGIGIIWFGSTFTRERSAIYMGSLFYSSLLFFSTFNASNSEYIDSHTAHRMLKVCIVFALFMGYLVVYSQEILYDAHFGEINFVNRTLSIFFRLPGILFHAARLCLVA